MSKLQLIIEDKAESDIKSIAEFFNERNVSLKLLKNFLKAFDTICTHPEIGFKKELFVYRNVRFFVVDKKFLIVYRKMDSSIHILRVLSTYQDICTKL